MNSASICLPWLAASPIMMPMQKAQRNCRERFSFFLNRDCVYLSNHPTICITSATSKVMTIAETLVLKDEMLSTTSYKLFLYYSNSDVRYQGELVSEFRQFAVTYELSFWATGPGWLDLITSSKSWSPLLTHIRTSIAMEQIMCNPNFDHFMIS